MFGSELPENLALIPLDPVRRTGDGAVVGERSPHVARDPELGHVPVGNLSHLLHEPDDRCLDPGAVVALDAGRQVEATLICEA